MKKDLPHLSGIDQTLSFLKTPYTFISEHCRELDSDIFETRINLKKTYCMTGEEAAAFFYSDAIARKGAMPEPLMATFLGKGSVQGLDGEEHRRRKDLFLSIMNDKSLEKFNQIALKAWEKRANHWSFGQRINLYEEAQLVHTEAVCEWFGIPLKEEDLKTRTDELTSLFDKAGAKNIEHFKARIKRIKAEKWIRELVREARESPRTQNLMSPFFRFVFYTDHKGELLSEKVTAVEILNVLRPAVAISLYTVFVTHAIHLYKKTIHPEDKEFFIQEVRRFYPFFPATMGRIKEDIEWQGYQLKKGVQVMLDLYGINHDPRLWEEPQEFNPDRFWDWNKSPNNFVPQGGGDHYQNHRCPGEWITINLMKVAYDFFTEKINFEVLEQDLSLDTSRLPAKVKSDFVFKLTSLKEPWLEEVKPNSQILHQ